MIASPTTTSSLFSAANSEPMQGQNNPKIDPLIAQASRALRRSSWLSWWVQVILTTVSAITLIFAKSVLSVQAGGTNALRNGTGGFFLAGSGIGFSFLSIIWTWGETRLSRRLTRRANTTRIYAAAITRRAITIGIAINIIGMAMTLLGAEQIVGVLAAKALSFQSLAGGAGVGLGINSPGSFVAQTLQPLDILIVQANTNTLLSHFCSLFFMLWYGQRWILRLDPPSQEEDENYEKPRGRRRLRR